MPVADVDCETVAPKSCDLPLIAAVWLSLLVYGAIAAPIPAVNEPHYLTKARHFVQPDWCANDFFLASPNAHTVFYVATSWLTCWLSLEQTAWVGRVAAMLVLATGWVSLISVLLPHRAAPLCVCWMFLALQACGNLSGEWLVGGIEGKVISYGLLFASLGQVLRNRLVRSGALAGIAIAFHPVVGAWGVLAFAGARLLNRGVWKWNSECGIEEQSAARLPFDAVGWVESSRPTGSRWYSWWASKTRPTLIAPQFHTTTVPRSRCGLLFQRVLSLLLLALLALPGLIPVVQLLLEAAPAATKRAATFIQVYYRLAHHLDPMLFPLRAYASYAVLLLLWVIGSRRVDRSEARRLFDRVVGWSVVFALAGLLVGAGPRPAAKMPWFMERAALLKFYPFRLADVLVPLAVSVVVVGGLGWRARVKASMNDAGPEGLLASLGKWAKLGLTPTVGVCALLFVFALGRAHSVVETNRYSGELRADWIDVCRWINVQLPTDAVVQAPHNGWAFKWFAGRAEYVAFKDCPQDAAGIVEWNRRLLFLKKWYEDQYVDQFYSANELRDLRRKTGITHLLTDRLGPLELEPIYRNVTFQVYDLSSLD